MFHFTKFGKCKTLNHTDRQKKKKKTNFVEGGIGFHTAEAAVFVTCGGHTSTSAGLLLLSFLFLPIDGTGLPGSAAL